MKTLPDGWFEVADKEATSFEAELKKEVCALHPLYGHQVRCLARRRDRDDFLFASPTSSRPIAAVHLTWSAEKTAVFPWTIFFESEEDFSQNWQRIFE
jgi:hypothetical protein